ncbi:hypothetical protein DMH02_028535 [Streptomyces sp. WAC 00631]|uniref:hypothetical protein n=1 Tax=unclassified Streptomyces TaxID=2593676 RepID=UPI000F78E37D|nr:MULTISPECIES: hypothetical protein [unclassified Streptomyces]MCC5037014.1 hypothetical protein [Streptomyces sp. WAC 00631]MCC9737623.1 hypothetical protein [Streptomyces sp. MNU89]
MQNLPEHVMDRIRALERQVHRLTEYVSNEPGAAPAAGAASAPPERETAPEDAGPERENRRHPRADGGRADGTRPP